VRSARLLAAALYWLAPSGTTKDAVRFLRDTMMRRGFTLVLGLAILGIPLATQAQPSGTMWRIGVLMFERPGALEALVEGLRELNYIEGRNIILEPRRAARAEELPRLASELARLDPHVIVAMSGTATRALKAATKTVPIVMASSGDAVRQGLVASLARPGGNVTGLTFISPELAAKRLQILKEAAPRAVRVAVIGCRSEDPVATAQWVEIQAAAPRMGLQLVPILVGPADLPRAFEGARRERIEAVLVLDCSSLRAERVTGLVGKARLPALYPSSRYVRAGGLMSYAWSSEEQYRRAAGFVDKILKGARPEDLPVEQPTKIELIVNLKTAKTLGLTMPPSLLARADKVIE
jgi:putative ABC transport system substrate-binding protein